MLYSQVDLDNKIYDITKDFEERIDYLKEEIEYEQSVSESVERELQEYEKKLKGGLELKLLRKLELEIRKAYVPLWAQNFDNAEIEHILRRLDVARSE